MGIRSASSWASWLNASQYHPISPMPTLGELVEGVVETTDRGSWLNSLKIFARRWRALTSSHGFTEGAKGKHVDPDPPLETPAEPRNLVPDCTPRTWPPRTADLRAGCAGSRPNTSGTDAPVFSRSNLAAATHDSGLWVAVTLQ